MSASGSQTLDFPAGLTVNVVATAPAPAPAPSIPTRVPPVSYSFVVSEDDDSLATRPYVNPYDIADPVSPATTVTQTVTIALSRARATDTVFTLAANTDDLDDAAPPAVYSVPASLTIMAGDTTGTADITITPGSATGTDRFFVIATAPSGILLDGTDRTEFVVGAPALQSGDDFAIFPTTIEAEAGSFGVFTLYNTAEAEIADAAVFFSNLNTLPEGVRLHFNTETPKAAPDTVINRDDTFGFPVTADGSITRHVVTVAETVEPGDYVIGRSTAGRALTLLAGRANFGFLSFVTLPSDITLRVTAPPVALSLIHI
ncbi:MAG: hypothetical protein MPK62_13975, partial [Alphaproteobacteria bacterium]|nr:hypothetical protein [Alphaproteobacteria bacterium]